MSQLSQELIDHILDHVAYGSTNWLGENLLQCALVGQSFRPRSQFHIFSAINIRGESKIREERIQNLLQIVQENSEIAHHIKELNLECQDSESSWIFEDETFTGLIEKISTVESPLRKLTILPGTDVEEDDSCFLKYAEPLIDRFFLPFISPFITSLSLHQLSNVPIEAVTTCINLTDLQLLRVEFEERDEFKHVISQSLKLRHLGHRLSRDALSKLLDPNSDGLSSALDLSQLKSFIIYTDELRDLVFEQNIIDLSPESLEDLHTITLLTACKSRIGFKAANILLNNNFDTLGNGVFHGSADLHRCTRLRSLHAHVLFPEDGLVSLRRTLSSIPTNLLESLSVEAKVAFCEFSEPEVVLNADWADFCSEVNRVMVDIGFKLDLKMTYMYRDIKKVDLEEHRGSLETRCQSIIERLHGEELSSLRNNPHVDLIFTHELEFDALSDDFDDLWD